MTSLSGTHVKAANPEPFQPYAAYRAWVEEDKSVIAWMEKYNPYRPGIHEKIQKLAEDVEANRASPAEMLGYVMSCKIFLTMLGDDKVQSLVHKILDIFSTSHGTEDSYPQGERCLANLYIWGCIDLNISQDNKKAQEWLLRAAEGGDLRAQYELGRRKVDETWCVNFDKDRNKRITDGLKWLWTAAQGLYPPALTWWKNTLLSNNTTHPPGSFLNVPREQIDEREQINEMAESCGLLSRLMACAPNDQQELLRGVLIRQMVAWEGNGVIFYPDSVMTALEKWEQESPRAIETLVQSLYELACLDRGAPISPTATPNNEPVVAPK